MAGVTTRRPPPWEMPRSLTCSSALVKRPKIFELASEQTRVVRAGMRSSLRHHHLCLSDLLAQLQQLFKLHCNFRRLKFHACESFESRNHLNLLDSTTQQRSRVKT